MFAILNISSMDNKMKSSVSTQGNNLSLEVENELYHSIFQSLPYYIFLIDEKLQVSYTNYFDLNKDSALINPMILGNVLRCVNALESGVCGTHAMCKKCMISASRSEERRVGKECR